PGGNLRLKAVVRTALPRVGGPRVDGTTTGGGGRGRAVISPRALRWAATVDGHGQAAFGAERAATTSSFLAPQRGCRWRRRISIASSSGSVAWGLARGRRDRSCKPSAPSAS